MPGSGVSGGRGDVQRPSEGVGTAQLLDEARPRVERAPVLVEGDEEDVGVVPEDVLGAVAMVDVRVHYRDPAQAVPAAQILHQDGHVVDVAEATVAVHHPHGVVAGRAGQ
jgi:hypothetical protein